MKKFGLLIALASILFTGHANAQAVQANGLRFMMRNNTNTVNLNIDLLNPGVASLIGYDPSSTWGRLDGGTGAIQVFLLGSGLNYDSPTSTISVSSVPAANITGLNTAAVPESGSNFYFTAARAVSAILSNIFTGTTAQYVDGTGALRTFPTAGAWTFQYPARALNSCFQISSTQDANFTYSVDISATITLGGGTAVATSYTNSGCTTGAQAIANGAVSSVALLGTSSIPLTGWLPAGKWIKLTGTATGGGSAAIDAVQSEALKP